MSENVFNVLFLCTGNTARSIMAEGILRKDGAGRFRSFSAGSQPKGIVNPFALKVLGSFGYPTDGYRSKSWEEFAAPGAPVMDFVFTVCDSAAGEACPVWPGQPMTAHWGIEDPAAVEGSDVQKEAAFNHAFRLPAEPHLGVRQSSCGQHRQDVSRLQAARNRQHGRSLGRLDEVGLMETFDPRRKLVAEALGTALLVATVVGSGAMAETLSKDVGVQLLGNTLPTGAILVVIITILGPISGAHFNPAVSLVFAWSGVMPRAHLAPAGRNATGRRKTFAFIACYHARQAPALARTRGTPGA